MVHLLADIYILLFHLRASHNYAGFKQTILTRNINIDSWVFKVGGSCVNNVNTSLLEEVHICKYLFRNAFITINTQLDISSLKIIFNSGLDSLEFLFWTKIWIWRVVDTLKNIIDQLKVG